MTLALAVRRGTGGKRTEAVSTPGGLLAATGCWSEGRNPAGLRLGRKGSGSTWKGPGKRRAVSRSPFFPPDERFPVSPKPGVCTTMQARH